MIPVLNRERLIAEALRSCRRQVYEAWECLVVDDGSTDATREVVERAAEEDARIRLLHRGRDPGGAAVCRNVGLGRSRGEYVVFLDSDDLLAPGALARRIGAVEGGADQDFVVFPGLRFTEAPLDDLEILDLSGEADPLTAFLQYRFPWTITGPLWRRRALLERLGGFDEAARGGGQDWELHVRALAMELRWRHADEAIPDHFVRSHPGQRISAGGSAEVVEARRGLYWRILDFLLPRISFTPERRRGFAGVYLQLVSEEMARRDPASAAADFGDFARRLEIEPGLVARAERYLHAPLLRWPTGRLRRATRRLLVGPLLPPSPTRVEVDPPDRARLAGELAGDPPPGASDSP